MAAGDAGDTVGGAQAGFAVMMAIGIGARSLVPIHDIEAAIVKAERAVGASVQVVATFADAAFVDSLKDAAKRTTRALALLPLAALQLRSGECQTTSERSQTLFGVASIAEAAALAAAGTGSTLVLPRLTCGYVTVAVAQSLDALDGNT